MRVPTRRECILTPPQTRSAPTLRASPRTCRGSYPRCLEHLAPHPPMAHAERGPDAKEGAARLGARSGPSRAEGLLVSSVLRTATQHALFRTSGRLDDEGVHHTYQDCFHYGLLHIGDDPGHSFFAFPKKGHPRRGACGSVGRRFCARPFSSDTQPYPARTTSFSSFIRQKFCQARHGLTHREIQKSSKYQFP